jgi:hypothetical protein
VVFDGAGKGDRPLANGVAGGSEQIIPRKHQQPAVPPRGQAIKVPLRLCLWALAMQGVPCENQ